ncbi:hypothetical protein BpHYR1_038414 [Brachionus plicatilis]|uniref:Uncharacterized protein n=1 Tax=Brachionus plicatilis TaxID=10195 RepID=A0A3M7PPC9_BRAPC|nr:hypothetical protein BpHYR1_038414 [Brachionus plicatilis]
MESDWWNLMKQYVFIKIPAIPEFLTVPNLNPSPNFNLLKKLKTGLGHGLRLVTFKQLCENPNPIRQSRRGILQQAGLRRRLTRKTSMIARCIEI